MSQAEKLARPHSWSLKYPPLYHQERPLEALRQHDLVVSTCSTGTGKTVASLLSHFDLNGETS